MYTTSGRKFNIDGPLNVGGKCPSPTYEYTHQGIDYCCCGDGCCWDKCTYDTPPDECLANVPNSSWYYDQGDGYWRAVANVN